MRLDVGKSCLLLQFTDSRFRNEHDATIGVEFGSRNLKINDKQIKLQIWDTVTVLLHLRPVRNRSSRSLGPTIAGTALIDANSSIGGILVYDVTNRQSFDNLVKWYNEIQGYACDKIEMVIVGNKIDLDERYLKSANLGARSSQRRGRSLPKSMDSTTSRLRRRQEKT